MTLYIHHTDNVIDVAPRALPTAWEYSSNFHRLPVPALRERGWLPVVEANEAIDHATEVRTGSTGANIGDAVEPGADSVTRTWQKRDKTTAELDLDIRDARANAYAQPVAQGGLSEGRASQTEAIGDTLDTIITQVEAMRRELGALATAEWSDRLAKIAAIKNTHRKP